MLPFFLFDSSTLLMFRQIAPSFQLDPLFRRTFLLALPVKEYPKVTAEMMFNPLEVFTTLAKILPEKHYWAIDEVNWKMGNLLIDCYEFGTHAK